MFIYGYCPLLLTCSAILTSLSSLAEEVRPGVFRTPDERFENLPDYPFAPHYLEVDGKGGKLRVHYVDEGPRDGDVVVFLHGNPTWSYLWRKIIPPTVDAGYRVIALDMVGEGKSDKPSEMSDYTVARHVEWMRQAIVDELDLRDITLVMHDWGGIIGLRVVAAHPDRFARLVVSNAGLPARDPSEPLPDPIPEPSGFLGMFQKMVRNNPNWPLWENIQQYSLVTLPQDVIDAYHAPYPDAKYLAAPRQYTQMLPTTPDNPQLPDNWEAWKTLRKFEGPTLGLFGAKDPVTGGRGPAAIEDIPGSAGQPHISLANAGHFLQEDDPEGFVDALIPWLNDTASVLPMKLATLMADDIPVAHTPEGYWKTMPPPVLEGCGEPLVEGAVDMRGLWKVVESKLNGEPSKMMIGGVQRIEQCGNRVVITAGGVTHDMRCDGTYENGVNDIGEPSTGGRKISVAASFEDGVHILRPKGMNITVERERDGDDLLWRYGPFSLRLVRIE